MIRTEKIERLKRELYKHRVEYRQDFIDHPWATAKEQEEEASRIIGSILGQLRKLGIYR